MKALIIRLEGDVFSTNSLSSSRSFSCEKLLNSQRAVNPEREREIGEGSTLSSRLKPSEFGERSVSLPHLASI